ncbi:ABC transporter ATP-binding protein [Streptomyces sparsogenes]|uniref:ABC-type quaternary amine transporter n=1 Tax=Streptomyces sparsogenes DSM 40356 TaxID=1331668 RepID=A0A1R1SK61_9ACTN|nr:ABC transporter ATP-binding protein [Streptomyces sparsogenes]OMI38670.1 spermidine/putrescine ABC transporter ATPase [Streptomyces sparsogenes DSM 40356]
MSADLGRGGSAPLEAAHPATAPREAGGLDAADLKRSGAAIELRGLTKAYGTSQAVRGVDLTIEPGEFMTFLGPSGSGKTTTLNMIAGFVPPTSGEILVDGRPLAATPPHRREMGMVFQGYALFPHLSVWDNIEFPLRQRKMPKARRRELVRAAVRTVQLEGFERRRPAQLSGGQQQRVAFARAIVYRPPVLLMDEPLGALDKKLREALQEEIREIHRKVGTTFLYVTHDQEEALSLSDRIAVYDDGRIVQVGTAEELYERPRSLFVAQFLGESTLLRGVVHPDDPRRLHAGAHGIPLSGSHGVRGDAVVVIRPEQLRLTAGGPAPGRAGVPVTVRDETYLGHSRKLTVELPGGHTGLVREGPGTASGLRVGDSGYATWDPAAAAVVPDL